MMIISKISSQVLVALQKSRMGFAALVLALLCGFVASTSLPEKVDTGGDDDGGGEDEDGDGGGDDDDDQL